VRFGGAAMVGGGVMLYVNMVVHEQYCLDLDHWRLKREVVLADAACLCLLLF
jgi:hypothetical protein